MSPIASVIGLYYFNEMLKLILMRHSKSSWDDPFLKDFDRPLNKRGIRNAETAGHFLSTKINKVKVCLCSPAIRTKQTLGLIKKSFNIATIKFDSRIYEASVRNLLQVLGEIKEVETVMLIGHNPAITILAEELSGREFGNIPTSGIVCISFHTNNWEEIEIAESDLNFYKFIEKD